MRTDRSAFSLRAKLVRMVMRVSPDLQNELIEINDRLFSETNINYSYAAIVRGLIALGLSSLQGKAKLAADFAGTQVPRGRKPGGERRPDERNQARGKHTPHGRVEVARSKAIAHPYGQALACVHVTDGLSSTIVGDDVTVGHSAILHGCIVGDHCLIGMGSILLDNCEIGAGSVIAAGSVVTARTKIPPRSLVRGTPAKIIREVTEQGGLLGVLGAEHYVSDARRDPSAAERAPSPSFHAIGTFACRDVASSALTGSTELYSAP